MTSAKKSKKGNISNLKLYNRVKSIAKKRFDVYPSAVANAWVVRNYKERGGRFSSRTKSTALKTGLQRWKRSGRK